MDSYLTLMRKFVIDCIFPEPPSESSNEGEYQEENFNITLSAEEWANIAPKELYYKKKEAHGMKKYKSLTPNVWTHIVTEHFWLVTKYNCCLVFKRAAVSDSGKHYIKMEAMCKGCNGIFIGYIDNAPPEGQRVIIPCKYNSKEPCKVAPARRLIRGFAKDAVVSSLKSDRDTAAGYRVKAAHDLMTFGDGEPPHLPSLNALRCLKYKILDEQHTDKIVINAIMDAKYTTPYRESIHDVGIDKFFVKYWTPTQINCYKEFARIALNPTIVIDATGGLIKNIPRPFKNRSRHIFLYQAVATDNVNLTFPVTQMLSERHDNIAMQYWLEDWKRAGVPNPKSVVCDRSRALLSGCVKAFTQSKSLLEYNTICYKIVVEGEVIARPSCFLRCDIAHIMKNITSWQPIKVMPYGVKQFYVRSIAEILKANDINTIRKLLLSLFTVSKSETIGKRVVNGDTSIEDTPAEKARLLLKEAISNIHFEEEVQNCYFENKDGINEDENDDEITIFKDTKHSSFRMWADICLQEATKLINIEGEHYNALHCPNIAPLLIDIIEDLPLVSSVMVPVFGYGEATASSASVESLFNTIKNRLFKAENLPIRADQFLIKHITMLEGQLRLAATNVLSSVSSEIQHSPEEVSIQQATFSFNKCPACTEGNYPGGAHRCIKCQQPVHIIYESCSRAIDNEEGYGQKRICTKCFNSNLPEDSVRENWGGLGYSPVRNNVLRKKINESPRAEESRKRKIINYLPVNENKKKRKKTNINSYLVRQPDLKHLSSALKGPKPVGVLKNGNRASELQPLVPKSSTLKVTLSNTCSFDSLAQILACVCNDSDKFCDFVDSVTPPIASSNFLLFCKNLATKGISASTYKSRLELLLQAFPETQSYPGGILLLNTESTAASMISKMMTDYPSVKVKTSCKRCSCSTDDKIQCLTVSVPENGLPQISDILNETLQDQIVKCNKCNGEKLIQRKPSKELIFLELINMNFIEETDILQEIEVKPCDLPKSIVVSGIKYFLRGFIGFSGRRSSLKNVGHYTAYVRRMNEAWELYDDAQNTKINVSASTVLPCQILVYTI